MPRYDKPPSDKDSNELTTIPEAWTEPRCHVCNSKYRRAIDRMLALGTGFTEISRVFGGEVDRRSIANHARKHLAYEEAAIRAIIDHESRVAEVDAEAGISGMVKRKVYLETALHKAMQQVQSDNVVIEPKDAVKIIDALNAFDRQTTGNQLDEIKIQFNAFLQAIREVASERNDAKLGSDILIRARQIIGTQVKDLVQLSPPV